MIPHNLRFSTARQIRQFLMSRVQRLKKPALRILPLFGGGSAWIKELWVNDGKHQNEHLAACKRYHQRSF